MSYRVLARFMTRGTVYEPGQEINPAPDAVNNLIHAGLVEPLPGKTKQKTHVKNRQISNMRDKQARPRTK